MYTESQSLTVFKLASTIPICPLGYVGMVVKAYLTMGKRDRHPVIIFLMRGRSLHWHSPVTMVMVIQCSICTNTGISCSAIPGDILTTHLPFGSHPGSRSMIPPGRRAAFIFSKYGFSNRHLAGPVRGYHYQTAIVAVQLVYNGPFCKLYSPLSPLPQSLLPPFLPFLLTLLSFLISLVPRLLRYDASAAMSSPMGSEESVMITSNCPAHCCMNSAPS